MERYLDENGVWAWDFSKESKKVASEVKQEAKAVEENPVEKAIKEIKSKKK